MTYCCGILLREGLVIVADTRTNAGLDNISTFRKLHVFEEPGHSVFALASAGNLSLAQSVISILSEGLENPETGQIETLMNAPTMFQAAQRIGRIIRHVHQTEAHALEAADVKFDAKHDAGARAFLSRDLANRVARMSLGDAAAKERTLAEDHQLSRAIELLHASRTQAQLLAATPPAPTSGK